MEYSQMSWKISSWHLSQIYQVFSDTNSGKPQQYLRKIRGQLCRGAETVVQAKQRGKNPTNFSGTFLIAVARMCGWSDAEDLKFKTGGGVTIFLAYFKVSFSSVMYYLKPLRRDNSHPDSFVSLNWVSFVFFFLLCFFRKCKFCSCLDICSAPSRGERSSNVCKSGTVNVRFTGRWAGTK